ncbi:hypothetical protein M8C21_004126, partial [Ambrosia artemisiifolia]
MIDKEPLTVGVSVSLPEAYDQCTRGPFLEIKNSPTVRECKPEKIYLIIKRVTEYVLRRHLSLTEDKIMHAVDQLDFSLVCDGGDLASDGSLLESFDTLAKRLRLLSDVPLGISGVQPLDSGLTLPNDASLVRGLGSKTWFLLYGPPEKAFQHQLIEDLCSGCGVRPVAGALTTAGLYGSSSSPYDTSARTRSQSSHMMGVEVDAQDDPIIGVSVDTVGGRQVACDQSCKNEIL